MQKVLMQKRNLLWTHSWLEQKPEDFFTVVGTEVGIWCPAHHTLVTACQVAEPPKPKGTAELSASKKGYSERKFPLSPKTVRAPFLVDFPREHSQWYRTNSITENIIRRNQERQLVKEGSPCCLHHFLHIEHIWLAPSFEEGPPKEQTFANFLYIFFFSLKAVNSESTMGFSIEGFLWKHTKYFC